MGEPAGLPSAAAGLVSTAPDFLAFGRMLLGRGRRVLSDASIAAMMSDQLTPAQKAASRDTPGYSDAQSWGFGGMVVLGADDSGAPGTYGWDGGLGTSFRADPARQAVTVLLANRSWTTPEPPPAFRAFRAGAPDALAFP